MKIVRIGLAPMAGFTDAPFRVMCGRHGADYAVSEMISSVALAHGDAKTEALSRIDPDEPPCALQLFGHDPATVAEAAAILAERRPCAVEINMGCPVKKIVSSGDGSALMREPELAARIVRRTADALAPSGVPLWVKIRAGWKKGEENAPVLARRLVDSGAVRITVHGRTRDMMYSPSSDNGVIRATVEAVGGEAEVFGNGDVASGEDAARMLSETGCDGILVGRAALGDPWIFSEIKAVLSGGAATPPSAEDRVKAATELLSAICSLYGEEVGVREARGRAAHFIKGIRGSAAVRDRLNRATSRREFEEILTSLI